MQQSESFRNDKLYQLKIPLYIHFKDSVLYQVHLHDLVQGRQYVRNMRFNDMKMYHEQNLKLKLQLPEFPKTHFFTKTNKNPQLIQERKKMLQKYFDIVINDPFARGTKQVKKFIAACKNGLKQKRSFSCDKTTEGTDLTKSRSCSKRKSQLNNNNYRSQKIC